MQTYPFSFTAQRGSTTIPAQGDLFVYESAVNAGGELRVKVKPDNAGEIVLRPGQRFRNPARVTAWNITSYTGTEIVEGSFIIGEGEFDDANTVNTFKLDGTFTNNVSVNNTPANPVPVAFDKSLSMENLIEYTGSKSYAAGVAIAGANVILTPAQNPNGVVLVNAFTSGTASLVAKATVPTAEFDGDVVLSIVGYNAAFTRAIKIPAGKGVYVWANTAGQLINVLHRVL